MRLSEAHGGQRHTTTARGNRLQRGGLLGVVIGLHAGIFLIVLAARTAVPQIIETPLIVDLLPAVPLEKPPEAKPLPMARQPAPRQPSTPTPRPPAAQIEATQSNLPAPAAPLALPHDPQPLLTERATAHVTAHVAEPLSQPRFDADYLKNPAPPYPPAARRMGEEGKVILLVLVSAQGAAESIEVKTASGSPRLDEAAVNTVKHWKFIPAKRGDSAVQSTVLVPIYFKLEQ